MVLHKIPNPVMIRNTHCNPEKKIKFWYKPRRWTDSSHRRLRVEVVQAGKSLPQDLEVKGCPTVHLNLASAVAEFTIQPCNLFSCWPVGLLVAAQAHQVANSGSSVDNSSVSPISRIKHKPGDVVPSGHCAGGTFCAVVGDIL